jgi:hypothetical protein
MTREERAGGTAAGSTGTVVVLVAGQRRGAVVRVEPPDQPWRYAPVVERAAAAGGGGVATVTEVPAVTCWVHLEGAQHENVRSAQVTVPVGGVTELDWRV